MLAGLPGLRFAAGPMATCHIDSIPRRAFYSWASKFEPVKRRDTSECELLLGPDETLVSMCDESFV